LRACAQKNIWIAERVTGGWIKLHNAKLHNGHVPLSIIGMAKSRRVRWEEYSAYMGQIGNPYRIVDAMPKGMKTPLGKHKRKIAR
jgi:hypothetical protein